MADTFRDWIEAAANVAREYADQPRFTNVAGARITQAAREIESRIRALTPPPASGDREALVELIDELFGRFMTQHHCEQLADAILAAGFKRGG